MIGEFQYLLGSRALGAGWLAWLFVAGTAFRRPAELCLCVSSLGPRYLLRQWSKPAPPVQHPGLGHRLLLLCFCLIWTPRQRLVDLYWCSLLSTEFPIDARKTHGRSRLPETARKDRTGVGTQRMV